MKIKGFSEVKVEKVKEAIQKLQVSALSDPQLVFRRTLSQLVD